MIARHGTAMHMEALVRNFRRVDRTQACRQQEQRSLHYYWDDDSASETVARYNRDRGLEMDADTGRSLWQGETMDYDMAVEGLLSAAVSATENLWERQSSRPLHK